MTRKSLGVVAVFVAILVGGAAIELGAVARRTSHNARWASATETQRGSGQATQGTQGTQTTPPPAGQGQPPAGQGSMGRPGGPGGGRGGPGGLNIGPPANPSPASIGWEW